MGDCNSFGWDDENEGSYCGTVGHRVTDDYCKSICGNKCEFIWKIVPAKSIMEKQK